MKTRRTASVSLLALALSMMALVPLVAAIDYEATILVNVKPFSKDFLGGTWNGNPNGANTLLWIIDTSSASPQFSGKDVSSITASYTYDGTNYLPLSPKSVQLLQDTITLVFDLKDMPVDPIGSKVVGTLTNGLSFEATGPGWTYIHH